MDKTLFTKYRPKFKGVSSREPNLETIIEWWYYTGLGKGEDLNKAERYTQEYIDSFIELAKKDCKCVR